MKNVKAKLQRGAVIVEGTVSLFLFTFFMYAVLSVSQVAYAQARVNVALDTSTKLIAEFSHVYFLTGVNEVFGNEGGTTSELANSIANSEVTEFLGEIASGLKGTGIGDVTGAVYETMKAFEGDSLGDFIENKAFEEMSHKLLEKNLNTSGTKSFKDKYFIVGDFDLSYSKPFEGDTRDLFMICNYRIELPILKFFGIKMPFDLRACSFTQAWGEDLAGTKGS